MQGNNFPTSTVKYNYYYLSWPWVSHVQVHVKFESSKQSTWIWVKVKVVHPQCSSLNPRHYRCWVWVNFQVQVESLMCKPESKSKAWCTRALKSCKIQFSITAIALQNVNSILMRNDAKSKEGTAVSESTAAVSVKTHLIMHILTGITLFHMCHMQAAFQCWSS